MRVLILPLVAALTFASIPGMAGHCTTWSTADADMTVDALAAAGGPVYYFDDLLCNVDPCFGIHAFWVYEETNGIPGLQRRDEIVDNTCHDLIPGDKIIY